MNSQATVDSKTESKSPEMTLVSNSDESVKPVHKVLIVEDSPSERAVLKIKLAKQGYEVLEAGNGKEAIELLQNTSVSLVISDWHMPEMDGVTLCKRVKKGLSTPPYFLILTSRTAPFDLIAAMDAGADDYLSKPFNGEELRVRVQAGIRLSGLSGELAAKNRELKLALKREKKLNLETQQGLVAAAKLQQSTLPAKDEVVHDVAIAHYFRAAQGVAGDTYSIFPLGEDHVGFYQVDVAGHGIRSAMLSYAISRYIKDKAQSFNTLEATSSLLTPAQLLQELNMEFACDDTYSDYFTIVYGVINTESGVGRLSQAGHPHPFIVKGDGTVVRIGEGGFPIGLFADVEFEEHGFKLNDSSRLIIYTDGIWECSLHKGQKFNETMLKQVVSRFAPLSMSKLQKHLENILDKLVANQLPEDDLSFLVLGRSS